MCNTTFIEFFRCETEIYLIDAHDDSNDSHELANKFAHSHLNRTANNRKYQRVYTFAFAYTNDAIGLIDTQHTPCDTRNRTKPLLSDLDVFLRTQSL